MRVVHWGFGATAALPSVVSLWHKVSINDAYSGSQLVTYLIVGGVLVALGFLALHASHVFVLEPNQVGFLDSFAAILYIVSTRNVLLNR